VPRPYKLGRRATSVAATHDRILEAALALYQEQGVSATTMLDVARRADVAPGTVANHFGSPDALATAVGERVLHDLEMPTPSIVDGIDDRRERVRMVCQSLASFYVRSEPWWRVSQREPGGTVAVWAEAERRYEQSFEALVRAMLGRTAADDPEAVLVASSLVDPHLVGALMIAGRAPDAAADLVADVTNTWLDTRD